MAKTYTQTYLFGQYNGYERQIYQFIINAERINTNSSEFEDILFDIKRRKISDALVKVLTSSNVVLGINPGGVPLPKAFKSFVAADAKSGSKKPKAFIDVSEIVKYNNGVYECSRIDWLISYTINAMTCYIYAMQASKLTTNPSVVKDGCAAWMNCFSYIIDRIFKVSTVRDIKDKLDYMCCIYYQVNLLEKDIEQNADSVRAVAVKTSGIDDRMARAVDVLLENGDFMNIHTFNAAIARVFNLKGMKDSAVVDKWMSAFGPGTVFAMEYFPAFAAMLTDTYVGGYINQQVTIEKVTGTSMVKFVKSILEIGAKCV